jgi:hypothetical protein
MISGHTHASFMAEAGARPKYVQKQLGLSSCEVLNQPWPEM